MSLLLLSLWTPNKYSNPQNLNGSLGLPLLKSHLEDDARYPQAPTESKYLNAGGLRVCSADHGMKAHACERLLRGTM